MRWKIVVPVAACWFLAVSLAGCAGELVVHQPPPQDREEVMSVAPSPEHFWVRGHWQWEGQQYAWVQGHWEVRRPNEVWAGGHWRSNSAGNWVWTEGRWTAR